MIETQDDLFKEKFPNISQVIKSKSKKCCSTETVKRFLPILTWLPKYRIDFLLKDCIAGLTVALTSIPQSIAYGIVAGLPPQYGLYSAFMGCFVYIFFGTCKDVTIGPTAITALMIKAHAVKGADFAVLACFLGGCIIFLMGVLNLGFLVQFISLPVVTGFTTAAAATIATAQINNLFGIKDSPSEFLASWEHFFTHMDNIRRNDAVLGIITLVLILSMRKIKDLSCNCKKFMKYASLSRNASAVIIGTLICYLLSTEGWSPFRITGDVSAGLPPFKLPPFTTNWNGIELSFAEMVSELGASIISIPLISVLDTIAIAKAFSKGKIVDASQEMVALGLCNIGGSFFSSIPITASFTRSALNNASGVKTTLGGAVTGILILMALAFLTQTFYYIPKATLAAVIIAAMIHLIEYEKIVQIWRSKKLDMFPFLVTMVTCLFWSLEYGIVCGLLVNLLFVLYKTARPAITIKTEKINGHEVGVVDVHENLSYSSAEYLKMKIIKFKTLESDNISVMVIKGEDIKSIDSTVGTNILSLKEDLAVLDCELICWNWSVSAAGVVCRLDKNARHMFKFSSHLNLQDVILPLNHANTLDFSNVG